MKEIDVNLNGFKYPIYITNNFDSLNTHLDEHKVNGSILIVTDDKVADLYIDEFTGRFTGRKISVFRMHPGEDGKNIDTVLGIYEDCIKYNMNRSSAIIAFGGGVVGDTAGFAASTYMRGIKLIQVPTTIIADVDSSVGGKVGINHKGIKNLIGGFYHPELIYINTALLKTLDKRNIISGIAEVIKYALLFDKDFFNYIDQNVSGLLNLEGDKLNYVIKKCISMKVSAVQNDITDKGERQLLNFGHTIGHSIETICNYTIYHGEAVALGMMVECALSYNHGMLCENDMFNIFELIHRFNLIRHFDFGKTKEIFSIIKYDKKADSNGVKFILLKAIGSGIIASNIKEDKLIDAFNIVQRYINTIE